MQDDTSSNPGLPFALGFTLEHLDAQTVDENLKPTFVTTNPMEILRKASAVCMIHRLQLDVQVCLHATVRCRAPALSLVHWAAGRPQLRLAERLRDRQIQSPTSMLTSGPTLSQASELRRMALYFDVGAELWRPDTPWKDADRAGWDRFFLPSVPALEDKALGGLAEIMQHTYVLQPIDGRMSYLRRGPRARQKPDDAVQQADLSLRTVSLHLARAAQLCLSF